MSDIQRERGEDSASRFGFLLKRRLPLFLFFFFLSFRTIELYCSIVQTIYICSFSNIFLEINCSILLFYFVVYSLYSVVSLLLILFYN